MHLKFLLGFLSLLTAATAVAEGGYVVPTDAAPGFYTVEFHEDGNTTTQKIDLDAAPLVPPARSRSAARRAPRSPGSSRSASAGEDRAGGWPSTTNTTP